MITLRTPKTQARYEDCLRDNTGRALASSPSVREFQLWRIIRNDFPYDGVFSVHDLLLPKRIVPHKLRLRYAEYMELERILLMISPDYDCFMENTARRRSVVSHYHLHLLTYREEQ